MDNKTVLLKVFMSVVVMVGLITTSLVSGNIHTCPHSFGENIEVAFGISNNKAFVQQGIWHRIPCPTYRPGENLVGVVWYRGTIIDDPSKIRLITHSHEEDYPASDRYAFSSGFSLLIKGVEEADQGSYLCQVLPQLTAYRTRKIELHVIGALFSVSLTDTSSIQSLVRGRRHTLPCECASQTPDVVYWSSGEDVTTYTQTIGARFSDGTTLQIQHGADYSIGSDASLTVNSLNDVQDTQRFWCHVFHQNGSLHNCSTAVSLSDELQPTDDPLKASETIFYLRKGGQQILPCLSWTPGDTTCEVEWSKLSNPDRQVLSYSLSTDVVDSSPEFDLASEFGLLIQSVDDVHAGVYRCAVGDKNQTDVEVRVIGDRFELDGGSATKGDSVTYKPETSYFFQCPALSYISLTTKSTLFWSYGTPYARTTSVIGMLYIDLNVSKVIRPRDDRFKLTADGTLLHRGRSQVGQVRYWCHVFPVNDDLIRSYVDVLINNELQPNLKAFETTFYLRKGRQQILPCLSWTPGDTACEVRWSKLDNPDRQVLSYNPSTGVVDSSPEFDLASEFGLLIQSVDDDHSGVYRCAVGDEKQTDVEVRVIGDRFELDGGSATQVDSVTSEPEKSYTCRCLALSYISFTTISTLFWSYGTPDNRTTTVVGMLYKEPYVSKVIRPRDQCFKLTADGTLLHQCRSQVGQVRYWCHVFPVNDDLIRSYVDVSINNTSSLFPWLICTFGAVVAVILTVIILIMISTWIMLRIRERKEK